MRATYYGARQVNQQIDTLIVVIENLFSRSSKSIHTKTSHLSSPHLYLHYLEHTLGHVWDVIIDAYRDYCDVC